MVTAAPSGRSISSAKPASRLAFSPCIARTTVMTSLAN
jgi:hypothetical protein